MKTLNVLLCLLLASSFIACSDDQEKEEMAQSRASVLIEEQNAIVNQLRNMGTPNTQWSEQRLDRFESLIVELEDVEQELGTLNGTNGISVYGTNETTIPMLRASLASVRARKAAGTISRITIPTLPTKGIGTLNAGPFRERLMSPPDLSGVFGAIENGERAAELENEIQAFKSENPSLLAIDLTSLTYPELLELENEVKTHHAVLAEYVEILQDRASLGRQEASRFDRRSDMRGVADAMALMKGVEVITTQSDLRLVELALVQIENQKGKVAEDYLMSQPVEVIPTSEANN